MATELIKGKKLDEVMSVTNKAVVEALDGLPVHKIHCPFWRRKLSRLR
jgi:nitrogen fixation NifU-like protein